MYRRSSAVGSRRVLLSSRYYALYRVVLVVHAQSGFEVGRFGRRKELLLVLIPTEVMNEEAAAAAAAERKGRGGGGGAKSPVISRYRRLSTGSCHDSCKHGGTHEFQNKEEEVSIKSFVAERRKKLAAAAAKQLKPSDGTKPRSKLAHVQSKDPIAEKRKKDCDGKKKNPSLFFYNSDSPQKKEFPKSDRNQNRDRNRNPAVSASSSKIKNNAMKMKKPVELKLKEGEDSVKEKTLYMITPTKPRSIVRKKNLNSGTHREIIMLKHQDQDLKNKKKAVQGLFNDVIESTARKLVKTRKSKVKALVGAFETVISLQETKPPPPPPPPPPAASASVI